MAALVISNQLSSNSLRPYGNHRASSVASTSVRSLLLPDQSDTDDELEEEERKIGLGGKKERRVRIAMLCCACCLSLGSHYSSHLLGPLKGSIKSESNFSSLVSSFQLVNTITPLVSGYLIPRIGLGKAAIAATGIVLFGLCVVCYEERNGLEGAIGGVVVGLAIFGMGTSPLAVVQESIILRTNSSSSKSVARILAAGLLLGKAASFLASAVAEPLSRISPQLPFLSAVALSLFSFFMAMVYLGLERFLPPEVFRDETTVEGSRDESHEAKPRVLSLREICSLGDPFFLYILVCFLAAIHYVTIHSGASLLRVFYDETKARSASAASALLFAAIVLYPTLGFALDRKPTVLPWLFGGVVVLLIFYYCVLLFATSIVPMFLAVIPAALAIGSGPLLLVVVVPRLVERHQLSTALGIHKSLEMAGSVILQAATSAILARAESPLAGARSVSILLIISGLAQLLAIIVWWWVISSRAAEDERIALNTGYSPAISNENEGRSFGIRGEQRALLERNELNRQKVVGNSRSSGETLRGVFAVGLGIFCIVLSWVVFFLNLGRES